MSTTRESTAPSPKRRACMPSSSAKPMILALDVVIWTSIIEFLPVRRASAGPADAMKEAVSTWRTLLNLRLVGKELAELLHPVKSRTLWQRLVLLMFDFSTEDKRWIVKNYNVDEGPHNPDGERDSDDEEETATATDGPTDPQLIAMQGRWEDMPEYFSDEDFVLWDKLGIYHRPSQYGFLTSLQQQPPSGSWPASEDPFSLFLDLMLLLKLPDGDKMDAGGEGGGPMYKCIAAPPTVALAGSPFDGNYVMQTLGYAPHFWNRGRGIGDEWRGFTDPNAFETAFEPQRPVRAYGGLGAIHRVSDVSLTDTDEFGMHLGLTDKNQFEDNDELYNLPLCSRGHAKMLFKHIQQCYSDWRSVCCNEGCDGETPVFFVGQSKAQPHRWTGYSGSKVWT